MSLAFLGGFVVVMVVLVVRAVRSDRKRRRFELVYGLMMQRDQRALTEPEFNPVKHDREAMEALRTGVVRFRSPQPPTGPSSMPRVASSSGMGERIRADAERHQREREARTAEAARMAQDLLDEADRQLMEAVSRRVTSLPAPVEPTPAPTYEPAPVEQHTPSVDHSPTHHDSSSSFDHGSSSFDHGSGGHHGGDW